MSAILGDMSVTFNFMQNKFQIGLGLLKLSLAQCGYWCLVTRILTEFETEIHSPDLREALQLVSPAPVSSRGSGRGKLQSVLCRAAQSQTITRRKILQTPH